MTHSHQVGTERPGFRLSAGAVGPPPPPGTNLAARPQAQRLGARGGRAIRSTCAAVEKSAGLSSEPRAWSRRLGCERAEVASCSRLTTTDTRALQRVIDGGACEVTGAAFRLDGGRTADSPSLDRIIPALGYVRGNVASSVTASTQGWAIGARQSYCVLSASGSGSNAIVPQVAATFIRAVMESLR